VEISIRVFGAHHFRPVAQWAPIAYGGRPGLGEDAVIHDGEFELQSLAHIVRVACQTGISPEPGKPNDLVRARTQPTVINKWES
jgi:hypothetical protein